MTDCHYTRRFASARHNFLHSSRHQHFYVLLDSVFWEISASDLFVNCLPSFLRRWNDTIFRLFTVVLTPLYEMINPSTDNSDICSICVSGQDRGLLL